MDEDFEMRKINDELSGIAERHNNVYNQEVEHVRDTFLSSEKEHLGDLLQDEGFRDAVAGVNHNYDADAIEKLAQDIIFKVENILIPEEKMEEVETTLLCALSAVQAKRKNLVLTKHPDLEEEPEYDMASGGRTR